MYQAKSKISVVTSRYIDILWSSIMIRFLRLRSSDTALIPTTFISRERPATRRERQIIFRYFLGIQDGLKLIRISLFENIEYSKD